MPVPASGVTIRLPTTDEARDALLGQARALAMAGVAAAGQALQHQLAPRGAALACEPDVPATDETCTAPDAVRGR